MTLQERYDHLLTLVTRLRELEDKELRCIRAGGRLPIQDRNEMRKVQAQVDTVIKSQQRVKQAGIFE